MKEKIKVIIKRPGEKDGREVLIENTLRAFQEAVGGHIEVVPVGHGAIMICNEEGKILDLQENFRMLREAPFVTAFDEIRGTVVICGVDGEEFADVPFSMDLWREILEYWGN